jgi:hypothetical protein
MTTQTLGRSRTWLALLTAVALAGTADLAEFALTEPAVAFKTAGRAGGTIFTLGVWVLLALAAGRTWRSPENSRLGLATVGLGTLAAIDGVGLAAIHLAAGVAGLRPLLGAALGVGSVALALSARKRG